VKATEGRQPALDLAAGADLAQAAPPAPRIGVGKKLFLQGCACGGGEAAAESAGVNTTPTYIFALGRVETRFPSLAVEKEFAQVTGRSETAGLTDQRAMHKVLTQRPNRYLARQLCWLFTIEGIETYILQPNDPADIDLLVEAVRGAPRGMATIRDKMGHCLHEFFTMRRSPERAAMRDGG
jgi:hypothetical protein